MDYSKLFIDNCPIVYFNKKEPYMPIDFDDILDIANIKPINLHKVNIIFLYDEDKEFNKIGKQILCKKTDEFEIDGNKYTDLIYIITYLWYGNKYEEHPFDKSIVIVRLDENNEFVKLCCVNKNESIWYDANELQFENNKPILFSSLKTHNLYNKEFHLKNFLLERDYVIKGIKWKPSEFIIFKEEYNDNFNNNIINKEYDNFSHMKNLIDTVSIFDNNGNKIDKDINHYLYDKNIGNEFFNQQMPSSIHYNTSKMEAFYNYNGDIFNLFNDYKNGLSFALLLKILLLLFIICMIGYDFIKYKTNTFNLSYLIVFVLLILCSTV